MDELLRRLAVLAFSIFVAGSSVAQPGEEHLLDPATGEIDGRVATAVYPAQYRDSQFHSVLDPEGFSVHLSPDGQSTELVFPCASWFQPPPGRYRIWVQGESEMTPYSVILGWAGGAFKGRAPTAALPVAPAGRVVVPRTLGASDREGLGIRLLRAEDHVEGDLARWEMSRYRELKEVGDGVLMPAGQALAGLWDGERYLALTRPFAVAPGMTVEAPFEAPGDDAYFVVALDRDEVAWKKDVYGATLSLVRGGAERTPGLKVETATRIFGVWYDLAPGSWELRAETSRATLPPQPIELEAGEIHRFGGQLIPRPDLQVELDLPAVLDREMELSLEVRSLPLGDIMVERREVGEERSLVFEDLPARRLELDLATPYGSFTQQVDLRAGANDFVVVRPELTVVSGTVFQGDEGHPAELTFSTTSESTRTIQAQTGADGRYEAVLVQPVRFVSVMLEGHDGAPFVEFFPHAITGHRELDLHVPAAEFRLEVVDAATGRGVSDATVFVRNYIAEEVPEGDEEPNRSVNQLVTTDESGWAELPPLREGEVELRVTATGYSKMSEPMKAEISGSSADQSYRVALEPVGETVALELRLPNGAPAAGAEVVLLGPGTPAAVEFSAQANSMGLVELPYPEASLPLQLVARHPEAAFLLRHWAPKSDEQELRATMPAAAEYPLTIQVVEPWGGNSVPQAGIAVKVDGQKLTGGGLAWAARTRVNADENGFWTGHNFPQRAVLVLAWERGLREAAYNGGLDTMATQVDYPWPGPVDIEAAW